MYISLILAILGGILAAASMIVARKPDAKQLIDKLTPYQGTIGVILFVWGVIDLIRGLSMISLIWQAPTLGIPLWGLIFLSIIVGFLLGFGLISKYALSKNPAAMAKGEEMRVKLAKVQGPLGLILVADAAYLLIRTVIG